MSKAGSRSALTAARFDALMEELSEGVVIIDAGGRVADFNAQAERFTGYARAEAIGRPYQRVLRWIGVGDQPIDPVALVLRSDGVPVERQELLLQHRDGRRHALRLKARALRGGGAVLVLEDVSERNLLAEELAYRAAHDPLTGLLNRDEFETRVRATVASVHRGGPSAVLCYFDVDQFKVINDTLGHVAGDELLHELAAELRGQLSARDTFARLGGDEFGVLLPERSLLSARAVAEGLLDAARRFRFSWGGQNHAVTISMGAVLIDHATENATQAMSMADAACHVAKDAGRDRVRFAGVDDEMSRQRLHMSLVGQISKALDESRFELFYEDVVPIAEPERVVYREFLVRLREEDGRLSTPAAFIQAAERYFLMNALDRWVVANALRAVTRLPADGVVYAINLSGQSLSDDKTLEFVLDELARSEVDPARICFEITETAAVSRMSEAVSFLGRLSQSGCRFALDDFGAGMASFSYLRNFAVDFLKIDGSFVRAMLASRVDRGMVETINRIGHEMGLTTIAEHVESAELMPSLREMGIDWAQGRAIGWSRPVAELLER